MRRREFLSSTSKSLFLGGVLANELHGKYTIKNYFNNSTLRFIRNPKAFVEPEKTDNLYTNYEHVSDGLHKFYTVFEEILDPLNGIYDVVNPVEQVITEKKGDCVDFSNLTISYLLRHSNKDIKLFVMIDPFNNSGETIGHISVFSDNVIYDSSFGIRKINFDDIYNGYKDNHSILKTFDIKNNY